MRIALGLSQEKFAASIGITTRTIRNYENGTSSLPLAARLAIIDRYGFDPLSTEQLCRDLGLSHSITQDIGMLTKVSQAGFWKRFRHEVDYYRTHHHSAFHQKVLRACDNTHAVMTGYFGIKHMALISGIPFGVEINGIDWVFVSSFLCIWCYIVWATIGTVRFFWKR